MSEDLEHPRNAFTKGWVQNLHETEALPIKTKSGVLVRVVRASKSNEINESKTAVINNNMENSGSLETESELMGISEALSTKNMTIQTLESSSDSIDIHQIQIDIGKICTEVVSNPEESLIIKRERELDDNGEPKPKLVDLLRMLKHPDIKVRELVMLSAVLVFKDICPSYRIRVLEKDEKETQLKKQTKKLRDFETALLKAYELYLKYLNKAISIAFNKSTKMITDWTGDIKLGLSALRCQCELLRTLMQFNYRSLLLDSIIFYAAHSNIEVSVICCDTIQYIFQNDTNGDTAYEVVHTMSKTISVLKYDIPERFLKCLEYTKLQVHADEAEAVRRKARADRKKRRKRDDDVEKGLLEADAISNRSISKRFQADCLHDISVIYFRIIKLKIGYRLYPLALEGLGRISHLLDLDTMVDMLAVLRKVLEDKTLSAPLLVRLLCVHCAMKTLSGPGKELGSDEDVYITALRLIIVEVPLTFDRWELLLESIELCLLSRSEPRSNVVLAFVRLLFLLSPHIGYPAGPVALSLAHVILLRYPRTRSTIAALSRKVVEEDEMADYAMRALHDEASVVDDGHGDGSWMLSLLLHTPDPHFENIVKAVSSQNVIPLPLRLSQAKSDDHEFAGSLDNMFSLIPATVRNIEKARMGKKYESKRDKRYRNSNKRKAI